MTAFLPSEINERYEAERIELDPDHHKLLLRQTTELLNAAHAYADELRAKGKSYEH